MHSRLHSHRDEELTLANGLSKNGKPAELVRKKKNGASISLIPDEARSTMSMKRGYESDEEDSAMRSMGRRRKADQGVVYKYDCKTCGKVFNRPCDLTKHNKTHTRPFKCPEPSCKYHTRGWPTEKECQRHFNDKHTATPKMYSCLYEGCSYSSKRSSNCKQHMEKTHGWVYERSKNNGKKRDSSSSTTGPSPMCNTFPPSPFSPTVPSLSHVHTPSSFHSAPSMGSAYSTHMGSVELANFSPYDPNLHLNTANLQFATQSGAGHLFSPVNHGTFMPSTANTNSTYPEISPTSTYISPMSTTSNAFTTHSTPPQPYHTMDMTTPDLHQHVHQHVDYCNPTLLDESLQFNFDQSVNMGGEASVNNNNNNFNFNDFTLMDDKYHSNDDMFALFNSTTGHEMDFGLEDL